MITPEQFAKMSVQDGNTGIDYKNIDAFLGVYNNVLYGKHVDCQGWVEVA